MKKTLIVGTSLVLLGGCAPFPHSETPLATNFQTTRQPKLQAAHHWQVIANDMADTLAASLARDSACVAASGNCPSLFVASTSPSSAFGTAFHAQFVSRLVNKGLKVTSSAPGDISISIDAQTVKFSPERSQYLGVGKFTMLATGVWALDEIANKASPGAAVVAAAIAGDVFEWNMSEFAKGPTPQLELVLTASATKGTQFLARNTSVYYLADTDGSLYSSSSNTLVKFRVVGDCGSTPCYSSGAVTGGGASK